jgi:hypothetical protein
MLRIPPALRPVLPYGLFAASLLLLLYHHLSEPVRLLELGQLAALEARPVNGRFPSWYGQPELVGPSPYDWEARWEPKEVVGARGGQGGRKRRVLFLTGQSTPGEPASTWRACAESCRRVLTRSRRLSLTLRLP